MGKGRGLRWDGRMCEVGPEGAEPEMGAGSKEGQNLSWWSLARR